MDRRLPWWTWLVPAVVCHLGTQASLHFAFAPGVSILYWPIPFALVLCLWWGPRALLGLYLNAVLSAGLWDLPRWQLWPIYGLPETLAVFVAWLLFDRLAHGQCWLPNLRQTVLFFFLAIVPAAVFNGFQVAGQLVLLGDIPREAFWVAGWSGWIATLLDCLAIAVPLLLFVTPFMERWGLTRTVGAQPVALVPGERVSRTTPLEVGIVFIGALVSSIWLPFEQYWFMYGLFAVWAALRFGVGMAVLANTWIEFLILVLPAALSGQFGASWTPDTQLINLDISLIILCSAALLVGRAISDLVDEIRQRQAAEKTLRNSEERHREISELVSDYAFSYRVEADGTTRLEWVTDALVRITGYTQDELRTLDQWDGLTHPEDRSIADRRRQQLSAGQLSVDEYRITAKDGRVLWLRLYNRPIWDTALGRVARIYGAAQDITRIKHLERQLNQAQKMEAIGRLAGGIAHDFNNLLTVILGNADMVLGDLDRVHPLRHDVEQIQQAAERAAVLTRQLLAFSRQQVLQPQILDLNAVVMNMGHMLRRLIGEDIDMVTRFAPSLGRVQTDPGQIEQVILNLAVNARDAMPAGGTLVIETADVRLDDGEQREHVGLENGAYVMLAISDTGIGMDAATRARIFEPFFTTKAVGQGTGLGLATVHGIVSQSGGHIWVYSELDYGTTFKIYLPRADTVVEVADTAQAPAHLHNGSGTILLVEDEPMVRELAARVLRSQGYEVLEAGDPRTALQVCSMYGDTIDVLLTDVIMPGGMNGRQLAEQVQAQYPAIKILYMSGYTDNLLAQHPSFMSVHTVLQKPFAPDALARTVWDVLHA